jgi:hypothetical protein
MSTISITTLCLHKHAKIASISRCPPYQSPTLCSYMSTISHSSYQTCQNCVHTQLSTISNDCTFVIQTPKMRPLYQDCVLFLYCCPHDYTLTIQMCQNCVHHWSSVCYIKTLHFCYPNISKLRASLVKCRWLHFYEPNMSKLRP